MSAGTSSWQRFTSGLPMRTALIAVGVVWLLGAVWSYQEQSAFAASRGFGFPHLLPLVIDGFAVSMAGVAWAASLDARPAVPARLATLLAVAGSAASNGAWAWLRTEHDRATVVLAVVVPVAANLAFEVLLAELRRQVQRRRGLPAPSPLPALRVIRVVLAPGDTFREWRRLVLELTALPAAGSVDVRPGRADVASRSWRGHADLGKAVNSDDTTTAVQEDTTMTSTDRPALAPAAGGGEPGGDARVRELAGLLAAGQTVTGALAAARYSVSERTGRRLVAAASALLLDTPAPAALARGERLMLLTTARSS